MKVFGSSKGSKHTAGHAHTHAASGRTGTGHTGSSGGGNKKRRKKGVPAWGRALIIVLAVAASLAAVGALYVKTQVKAPPVSQDMNDPTKNKTDQVDPDTVSDGGEGEHGNTKPSNPNLRDPAQEDGEEADGETPPSRVDGIYTFLVVAKDKVGANTDAIMVAKFDTNDYTLNVASIPRDTLVNVTYNSKLVNALYANYKEEGLVEGIANLVGFKPDFYGIITLDAIAKIVDAVGGVKYNVPQNMNYDDDVQDLHIHFKKGTQTLNGKQAVEYMRFRKGYADADIGRIHAQQSFLTTMAGQVLANKDKVPITTIIDIFMNDVKTSLTVAECGWFAKELLKMDAENIQFFTMPGNYNDTVKGRGFVTIKVEEWLEMINEYLNPFDSDITTKNVDILSKDSSGKLYATSGVIKDSAWRSGSSGSSSSGSKSSGSKSSGSSSSGSSSSGSSSSGSSSFGGSTSSGTPSTDEPTTPTEPTEPTEPTNPDPGTSGEPTEPTTPEDPGTSGEPTEPADPEDPGASGEPTEPTTPDDPGDGGGEEPAEQPTEDPGTQEPPVQPDPGIGGEDPGDGGTGV